MAALMRKDVELPAGNPRLGEDVTGVHPGLAVQFHMLRMLPYASLRLKRRGDLDVAITRLLPSLLALGGRWCSERGFDPGSAAMTFGRLLIRRRKSRRNMWRLFSNAARAPSSNLRALVSWLARYLAWPLVVQHGQRRPMTWLVRLLLLRLHRPRRTVPRTPDASQQVDPCLSS